MRSPCRVNAIGNSRAHLTILDGRRPWDNTYEWYIAHYTGKRTVHKGWIVIHKMIMIDPFTVDMIAYDNNNVEWTFRHQPSRKEIMNVELLQEDWLFGPIV